MHSKKKFRRFVNECGTISMIEFLTAYVGINSQLDSLKMATHKNIKSLRFDKVVSIPFSMVNIDDLEYGDVLFVRDCNYNIGAYKNPLRLDLNNNKQRKLVLISDKEELK